MQTIKTDRGTYKISDTRDAAEFMRRLAKPTNPRKRPEPAPLRTFPMYIPGQTSVRDYVRNYLAGNKEQADESYFHQYFGHLPTTPASVYDPAQPLVEVHHD